MTTLALAASTCCHDPRVKAAAILSGRELPFGRGTFFTRIRAPLLLVHGDADDSVASAEAARRMPTRHLLVSWSRSSAGITSSCTTRRRGPRPV